MGSALSTILQVILKSPPGRCASARHFAALSLARMMPLGTHKAAQSARTTRQKAQEGGGKGQQPKGGAGSSV